MQMSQTSQTKCFVFTLSASRRTSCFHEASVNLSCVGIAVNVALRRPAVQISTYGSRTASLAVDNDLTTSACTKYDTTTEPWLAVDLGKPMDVGRVCVTNDFNVDRGKPQSNANRSVNQLI